MKAFRDLARILNLIDQRSNALIYLLFNGLFLYDIMLLRRILYWKEQHLDQMEQWLSDVAEFDALVSLANYAYNHPSRTVAEVLPADSDVVVEATEVYHPFLSDGQAVTNNFTLRKGNVAVVTGANMAGKSTFLRTIGLNYILACNGVPVCATSFKFMIVALFSSMRTTDNLSKDISYFHAELMRLKQLLLFVQTHPYTLIILDEILKGTNSKDKLEGSRMFLYEIIRYRVAALIATHDLELAKLEEEKGEVFQNFCFEIELSAQIK
ncbi:DNA mismatch repair protein MutS domain-containing protein [gut metagenome]|uniref:DNA mismatch repair protein MutS domain-containing protein n=1 Tax=gut metagenome TaxID=749906 RepID=J9GA98_9ZZZZ